MCSRVALIVLALGLAAPALADGPQNPSIVIETSDPSIVIETSDAAEAEAPQASPPPPGASPLPSGVVTWLWWMLRQWVAPL